MITKRQILSKKGRFLFDFPVLKRNNFFAKRRLMHTLWCLIEGGIGIVGGMEKSPKAD